MAKTTRARVVAGCVLLIVFVAAYLYVRASGVMLSFEDVKDARRELSDVFMWHPTLGIVLFGAFYAVVVALSLPLATPLSIFAGYLFGTLIGTMVVAVGATVGATLIFLFARYFFRSYFEEKVGGGMKGINREFMGHGLRDILILRLIPLVPFSLINVGAALTKLRLSHYVLGTLVGILPFTFVYVNAGTRIAEFETLSDIVSLKTLIIVSVIIIFAAIPIVLRSRLEEHGKKAPH